MKPLTTDTFKQQLLARALNRAGYHQGWRAYLLAWRQSGMSAQRLAVKLAQETGIQLNNTTLIEWTKQAEAEAAHAASKPTATKETL